VTEVTNLAGLTADDDWFYGEKGHPAHANRCHEPRGVTAALQILCKILAGAALPEE
jgi:hypothetical protein